MRRPTTQPDQKFRRFFSFLVTSRGAARIILALSTVVISLGMSQSVYAQAFPGLPGTEDFSSDALEGPATTAEWDNTAPHVLRLSLSTSTDPVV